MFAPAGTARITAAIYGVGLNALFIASAVYHRWPPTSRWKPVLRRVDHCVIFVFIAASYTPVAALVLEPPSSTIVLVSVWAGALLGVVFSVAWIDAPRLAVALAYIGVGWVIVIALPEIFGDAGVGAGSAVPGRRAALLGRRGRLRAQAARPVAADVRLPRAVPRARDRRRAAALRRDGRLGHPGRGLDPAFAAGDQHGLRAVGGAELRVHVVQVAADRARRDPRSWAISL